MKEDIANIEWGKEWKWGIVKNSYKMYGYRGSVLGAYRVVENAIASFASEANRVATDLTYEEACALCTILNNGGHDD